MKNLIFVIWMFMFPIVCALSDALTNSFSSYFGLFLRFIIWFVVGALLFERNDPIKPV